MFELVHFLFILSHMIGFGFILKSVFDLGAHEISAKQFKRAMNFGKYGSYYVFFSIVSHVLYTLVIE